MIIGQKQLLEKLNTFNIDTFPRSVLLLGEKGSGKHTIVNYIKDNILKLPVIDITENLSPEIIDEIYRNPNPNIYLINLSDITEKEQNIILKFIEEPLQNSFIIMLSESTFNLLNTVLNRSFILELNKYSEQELLQVNQEYQLQIDNIENVIKIIKTPGQLINSNTKILTDLFNLCDKIVNKIDCANYPNTLSIANKINYKDNYDKFDIFMFFDTLSYKLFNKYIQDKNKKDYNRYLLTVDYRKKLIDNRLNKEQLIQNFLINLKRVI